MNILNFPGWKNLSASAIDICLFLWNRNRFDVGLTYKLVVACSREDVLPGCIAELNLKGLIRLVNWKTLILIIT